MPSYCTRTISKQRTLKRLPEFTWGDEAELEKIVRRMHEVEGLKKRADDEPMVDAVGVPLEIGTTVAVFLPPK